MLASSTDLRWTVPVWAVSKGLDSRAGPWGSRKGLKTPWISEPLRSSPPAPSSPGVSTPRPCRNFLPTCLGLGKCSSPPPLGDSPGHRAVPMVNATESLATEFAPVSTAHSWRAGGDHVLFFCPCHLPGSLQEASGSTGNGSLGSYCEIVGSGF